MDGVKGSTTLVRVNTLQQVDNIIIHLHERLRQTEDLQLGLGLGSCRWNMLSTVDSWEHISPARTGIRFTFVTCDIKATALKSPEGDAFFGTSTKHDVDVLASLLAWTVKKTGPGAEVRCSLIWPLVFNQRTARLSFPVYISFNAAFSIKTFHWSWKLYWNKSLHQIRNKKSFDIQCCSWTLYFKQFIWRLSPATRLQLAGNSSGVSAVSPSVQQAEPNSHRQTVHVVKKLYYWPHKYRPFTISQHP